MVACCAVALLAGRLLSPPDDEDQQLATADGATSTASSPFVVGWVPQGYEPFTAGRGTAEQLWGDDSVGTDEPFTLLVPPDGDDPADLVAVSVTGYAGYQGHFAQAAASFPGPPAWFEVDGRQAIFTEGLESTGSPGADEAQGEIRSEVVLDREEDLAVRVSGPRARAELAAMATSARPRGRSRAPEVDAPEGLRVVGHADADLVLGLGAWARPGMDGVPGPASAHGAAWERAGSTLVVLTVPGAAGDVAAALGQPLFTRDTSAQEVAAGGGPAVLVEQTFDEGDCRPAPCGAHTRSVVSTTASGDLLVVRTSGADPIATAEELLRVAGSVGTTDTATWDAFVVEAAGGPGLHADRGTHEVARGTQGTTEWLLQARTVAGDSSLEPGPREGTDVAADPCLKTSVGRRVCASSGIDAVAWGTLQHTHADPDPALSGFVVVTTTIEAASMRVTAGSEVTTAPLVRLPGAVPKWAGVAFVARPGFSTCEAAPVDTPLDRMRVELLDPAGSPLLCLS